MCIAVPGKITEIKDDVGIIDVEGVKKAASLLLIEKPEIGDYVIVHSGFVMHKMDKAEALESLKLMKQAVAS
jgi:hydrogenase expression/formation protein HypC